MKLIIAGSRTLNISYDKMLDLLYEVGLYKSGELYFNEVVCGEANGVDKSGRYLAENFPDKDISIKSFPADWNKHSKAAGPIRNKEMAEYADALLLIWDGKSKGSANMKQNMQKLNKPIYEVIINKE